MSVSRVKSLLKESKSNEAAEQFFNLEDQEKLSLINSFSSFELIDAMNTFYSIGDKSVTRFSCKELFKNAWNTWGEILQVAVTAEELGEACIAFNRIIRGRYKPDSKEVVSEIADSFIVLDSFINQYDLREEVNKEIKFKLERLKKRLAEG